MKALRIVLVILGCAAIVSNIGMIALSEFTPVPAGADMLQLLGIYVSKMYLLIGGILLVVISSNLRQETKNKHLA
ncbi:MAG: hypothetical protein JWP88_1225 [Flaviaesturariibacter sp.]|nr:hypothetical protein [Flaviaesturariibacter sp.]